MLLVRCLCLYIYTDDEELSEAPEDPFLQLISLQKASGCWEMESTLAEVFGKTEKELIEQIPAQVNTQ